MPYYFGLRQTWVMTTEGMRPSSGSAVLSLPYVTREAAESCRAASRAADMAMSPVFFANNAEEAEQQIERITSGN